MIWSHLVSILNSVFKAKWTHVWSSFTYIAVSSQSPLRDHCSSQEIRSPGEVRFGPSFQGETVLRGRPATAWTSDSPFGEWNKGSVSEHKVQCGKIKEVFLEKRSYELGLEGEKEEKQPSRKVCGRKVGSWEEMRRGLNRKGTLKIPIWMESLSLVVQWWIICLQFRRLGFDPSVGKILWRRKWQPTPLFFLGESHGQRSLVGYSPWARTWVGHAWRDLACTHVALRK